jgi:hypothetical protein
MKFVLVIYNDSTLVDALAQGAADGMMHECLTCAAVSRSRQDSARGRLARQTEGLQIVGDDVCRHGEDDLPVRLALAAV